MKIKFDSEPLYGDKDKYIKTKMKIYEMLCLFAIDNVC